MAMIVELTQIPDEGLHLDLHEALQLQGEEPEGHRCAVDARVSLQKTGLGVTVRGRFRCTVPLACGRCLEAFGLTLEESFEVQYLPPEALGSQEERELSGAELDVLPLQEDGIDLTDLLRESLLLSLPVQPVCAEGCRGLCARCGANLNAGPCSCPPPGPDPRLRALAKLRPDSSREP